jgi:hypothetical protein
MRSLTQHADDRTPETVRQPPVPALPHVTPPTLRVAMPDGSQRELPGVLWDNLGAWMASADATQPPPINVRVLTRKEANIPVGAWHDLGPETRPFGYSAFGLYVFGELLAVATAATTASKVVDTSENLCRLNTIELTRICRSPDRKAAGVLRVMLRLFRDFLAVHYPPLNTKSLPTVALVTYSLPGKKGGDLYRFDGWVRVRNCKRSGGGGTWSSPSRGCPEALWMYRIPAGASRPVPPAARGALPTA